VIRSRADADLEHPLATPSRELCHRVDTGLAQVPLTLDGCEPGPGEARMLAQGVRRGAARLVLPVGSYGRPSRALSGVIP
jgi:hypothetical protein